MRLYQIDHIKDLMDALGVTTKDLNDAKDRQRQLERQPEEFLKEILDPWKNDIL